MASDPSTPQVLALLIGSLGLGYTLYGRKQSQPVALGCGVLLLLAPYGIPNLPALLLVSLSLAVLPFLVQRWLR